MSEPVLDRPIWESLSTSHAGWALGGALAKRYPAEVSPLAALRDQSPESYAALGEVFAPEEPAALFLTEPARPPRGWRAVREFEMEQMACARAPELPRSDAALVPLGPADVPEMIALAELAKPGPFGARTIEFGGYLGVREGGRLLAMAGRRTRPAGFAEVSAVCTRPDARGRGLAALLVAAVTRAIIAGGETPFLHLRLGNDAARRVYERLGYRLRRRLGYAAVSRM